VKSRHSAPTRNTFPESFTCVRAGPNCGYAQAMPGVRMGRRQRLVSSTKRFTSHFLPRPLDGFGSQGACLAQLLLRPLSIRMEMGTKHISNNAYYANGWQAAQSKPLGISGWEMSKRGSLLAFRSGSCSWLAAGSPTAPLAATTTLTSTKESLRTRAFALHQNTKAIAEEN
jgi:hypothetical protein